MARVRIPDLELDLPASPAKTLLQVLQQAGVPIMHRCGGKAGCGTCRVTVLEGLDRCSPIRDREALRLAVMNAKPGTRLACQTHIAGDVTIKVPKPVPLKPIV